MSEILELPDVSLAYDVAGQGEPVVLVSGCGAPALAFHLELVPALVELGYQVVTFDQRGMPPSSAPPAPYSVDDLACDLWRLLDHLGLGDVPVAGHSMGGWVCEMLAARHPERVRAAAFMGSCNASTSWEKANTRVQRDMALLEEPLPPLCDAIDTLRYLPNSDLQDDGIVDGWLSIIGEMEPWVNPGRLGQYEASLQWSTNPDRTAHWPSLRMPCLVMAFEHDIDSPPARAREAATKIPGARFVEIEGASHLGIMTHGGSVARHLGDFFASV